MLVRAILGAVPLQTEGADGVAVTTGLGLTAIITVEVAAWQGPVPSGSFVVNVKMILPLAAALAV